VGKHDGRYVLAGTPLNGAEPRGRWRVARLGAGSRREEDERGHRRLEGRTASTGDRPASREPRVALATSEAHATCRRDDRSAAPPGRGVEASPRRGVIRAWMGRSTRVCAPRGTTTAPASVHRLDRRARVQRASPDTIAPTVVRWELRKSAYLAGARSAWQVRSAHGGRRGWGATRALRAVGRTWVGRVSSSPQSRRPRRARGAASTRSPQQTTDALRAHGTAACGLLVQLMSRDSRPRASGRGSISTGASRRGAKRSPRGEVTREAEHGRARAHAEAAPGGEGGPRMRCYRALPFPSASCLCGRRTARGGGRRGVSCYGAECRAALFLALDRRGPGMLGGAIDAASSPSSAGSPVGTIADVST